MQVGSTTQPFVVVEPQAVTLKIEDGAFHVEARTAPLPENVFDRLWLWIGIACVAGVAGYWGNRWLRLAVAKRGPHSRGA